jgi:hypothetical protein
VLCSVVVAPRIGSVGPSLELVEGRVGAGWEMRVSIEDEVRMSDMRFGGIVVGWSQFRWDTVYEILKG